jgi:cytochrome c oxidase subunit 2
VIHSFWVPRLQGKIDLVPGQINSLIITAKEAGVYKGRCAEFCGIQHAKMKFVVVAEPEQDFQMWLAQQRRPAATIADPALLRGKQIFFNAACSTCHTVRGTPANGETAPDLTHIGSRLTLAAGTLPNTTGHMAGWIAGPQDIKRGSLMPLVRLEPDELQLLVGYLQSLK